MNKFEKLEAEADFHVGFLGNVASGDYEVVDLGPTSSQPTEEVLRNRRERGLYFIGSAGMVQGCPQTALEEPYGPEVTEILAKAYVKHLEAALRENIEVLSLTALHGLPDSRTN